MRSRTGFVIVVALTAALLTAGATSSSGAGSGEGAIAGRVVMADGNAPANPDVTVYRFSQDHWYSWDADTRQDGVFLADALTPGRYKLLASSPRLHNPFGPDSPWSDVAPQWYPSADAFADAADIVVTAGSTTPLGDIVLPAGGHVTGHVLDDGGDPLPGDDQVEAMSLGPYGWQPEGYVEVDADGAFDVPQLNGGPYALRLNGGEFTIWQDAARFAATFNGDVAAVEDAPAIKPTSGATTSIGVIHPIANGTLGGTVVGPSGEPVAGIRVEVPGALINPGLFTSTDAAGRWDVGPLRAGEWPVELRDPSGTYEYKDLGSAAFLDMPGRVAVRLRERTDVLTKLEYAAPSTVRSVTIGWREGAVVPIGTVLTAYTGTWLPTGTTTRVQWLRDGQPIPGATDLTYTVTPGDADRRIRARVVAGANGRSTTVHTDDVVAAGGTRLDEPAIDDATPEWQQVLTVSPRGRQPGPYSWQWYRDGAAISGATASTYRVADADHGHRLAASMTWTDDIGRIVTGYSSSTHPVVGVRPAVSVRAKAQRGRTVRLTIRARSARIAAALIDSRVTISRVRKGADTIGVRYMKDGNLQVTLRRQPKGRQTYYVTVLGSTHRIDAVTGSRVRVTVR